MKRLESLNNSLFEKFKKYEVCELNKVVGGRGTATKYTSVLPHKFFDISFDCINEFFNIISFSDSPIKNRS